VKRLRGLAARCENLTAVSVEPHFSKTIESSSFRVDPYPEYFAHPFSIIWARRLKLQPLKLDPKGIETCSFFN
jgi:hypothetical protein